MSRKYKWNWELEDDAKTPVTIVAYVLGKDAPARGLEPPRYREVEVEVRKYFCPSADDRDGCTGCEYEDVTESCSTDFLERMSDLALELDDEAFERRHEDD